MGARRQLWPQSAAAARAPAAALTARAARAAAAVRAAPGTARVPLPLGCVHRPGTGLLRARGGGEGLRHRRLHAHVRRAQRVR